MHTLVPGVNTKMHNYLKKKQWLKFSLKIYRQDYMCNLSYVLHIPIQQSLSKPAKIVSALVPVYIIPSSILIMKPLS